MSQRELPIAALPHAKRTPASRPHEEHVTSASHAELSALRVSVAMLGLFGLGLGAFVLYTHAFMSQPAEIGLERSIDPPHPRSHELQPPSAAGTPAPVHACAHGGSPR